MQIDKWSALAGLRCVLAFIVAVNHLPDFIPIGAWAIVPRFGAFEAILGFLLVSGYSIGCSYAQGPVGFLQRRVMRLYPIYAAGMVLATMVFVLEQGALPSFRVMAANALFMNQIVTTGSLVGPAWSLALEFWLYCLTPLLFTLSPKALRRLTLVSFVAFLLYTCGRTLFHWKYYAGVGFGLNLLLLSFIWLAGLRLARDKADASRTWVEIGLMFAVHLALTGSIQAASSFKRGTLGSFVGDGLIDLALQAVLLVSVLWVFRWLLTTGSGGSAGTRGSAALRVMGDISYPLYLVHIPVFWMFKQAGLTSPLVYLGGAFGVSALLYLMLDRYSQSRHEALRQPPPATTAGPGLHAASATLARRA